MLAKTPEAGYEATWIDVCPSEHQSFFGKVFP